MERLHHGPLMKTSGLGSSELGTHMIENFSIESIISPIETIIYDFFERVMDHVHLFIRRTLNDPDSG